MLSKCVAFYMQLYVFFTYNYFFCKTIYELLCSEFVVGIFLYCPLDACYWPLLSDSIMYLVFCRTVPIFLNKQCNNVVSFLVLRLYVWLYFFYRSLRFSTMHKKQCSIRRAHYLTRNHKLWSLNVCEPWSGYSSFVITTGMVLSVMQSWMTFRYFFF